MPSIFINLVVEDEVQSNILYKVIIDQDLPLEINAVYGLKGNSYIKKNLRAFNAAAKYTPYLVLTDSDQYGCAKKMLDDWISFETNPNFIFRIAIREAEAWLLADRENFARFFGVARASIPVSSESIDNPKEFLLNLVRHSKYKRIKDDMLPLGNALRGAGYNDALSEFVLNHWNVEKASKSSESLARLIRRLNRFIK